MDVPHSNGVHASMSTSTHDVPALLVLVDFFRCQADFTSSWDTLAVRCERGHGCAFSWSHVCVPAG